MVSNNNAQLCRKLWKIQICLMDLVHSHRRNLKLYNISEKRWKIYLGRGSRRSIIQRRLTQLNALTVIRLTKCGNQETWENISLGKAY
jgi:hypothetical protein